MLQEKLRRAYATGDLAYILRRYMTTTVYRDGWVHLRGWRINETVDSKK